MPTNEERREVAARLREKHSEQFGMFVPQSMEMQACNRLESLLDCLPERRDMFLVLANLIEPEPEPERTCYWEWDVEEDCWSCSNCGPMPPEDYYKIPSYCPECGAKTQF